jgi:hypothetical protein
MRFVISALLVASMLDACSTNDAASTRDGSIDIDAEAGAAMGGASVDGGWDASSGESGDTNAVDAASDGFDAWDGKLVIGGCEGWPTSLPPSCAGPASLAIPNGESVELDWTPKTGACALALSPPGYFDPTLGILHFHDGLVCHGSCDGFDELSVGWPNLIGWGADGVYYGNFTLESTTAGTIPVECEGGCLIGLPDSSDVTLVLALYAGADHARCGSVEVTFRYAKANRLVTVLSISLGS